MRPADEYVLSGWYEFQRPGGSTTHIAYVHEDGSVYVPESDVTPDEFHLAAASLQFYPLYRRVLS